MKKETGGPAFPALPIKRKENGEMLYQAEGITIRDYFAAMALQGMLVDDGWDVNYIANKSYELADAMLKARVEQ